MKFGYVSAAVFAIGLFYGELNASTIGGSAPPPVDASIVNGAWFASSEVSDQIQSKIVVLKRTKRGEEMEIRWRVHFDNVPTEKKYKVYLLTGYMEKNGLPEVDISKQFGLFVPNNSGQIVAENGALFYKGEWVRMRLRSVDGTIEKAVRFTLYK